jgi:hypothetical protein
MPLFQTDYWAKSNDELIALAAKYHIDTQKLIYNDSLDVFDRQKTIDGLLIRDNAMRSKLATIVSILAIVISAFALLVSVLK